MTALRLSRDLAAWAQLAADLVNTAPRATDPPEKLVDVAELERLLARGPEPALPVGVRDVARFRALREPLRAAFEADAEAAFADAVNPLLAPSYPAALATFALAGASNAPFFTATLAARSRYSPGPARAQVFVSMAGLKVATASAGTALAGAASGVGPRTLIAVGALITLAAAVATAIDRRVTGRQPAPA